jgi:single-stranded DNA-binding protein
MNGIEAAFTGKVMKPGELRTSSAGKPWITLTVMVGQGDDAQWVNVVAFGEQAEAVAGIEKLSSVYVEGKIALNTWTSQDGAQKAGLKVAASSIQVLGQIGHRKPAKRQEGPSSPSSTPEARRTYDAAQRPLEGHSERGRGWGAEEIPF